MTVNESQTELINREAVDSQLTDVFKQISNSGIPMSCASNFDGTNDNQLRLASIATGGGSEPGQQWINKEFTFHYWFIHTVEIQDDKSGEVTVAPRTVLISNDGDAISFVSFGVAQSLRVILQYKGIDKLANGVTVAVKARGTRKGYRVLYLEPVVDK